MADSRKPRKKPAAKKQAPKKPRPKKGDTQEFELGDDFLSDLDDEQAKAAPKPSAPEPSEEVTEVRRPDADDEQEDELDEVVSAETQEFVPPGTEDDEEEELESEELESEEHHQ